MNIYLISVIVSILIYMVVGWYAGTKVKNVDDYYVSGRNAPTILITGTLVASYFSTNLFMGDAGWAYGGNLTSLILVDALICVGYVLGPMLFGRFLRRSEARTMPEYFGKRFNSKKIQCVTGIVNIIVLCAYLLAAIRGVGVLLQEMTGIPLIGCYVIAWVAFVSFTLYSGSSGVLLTDTLMFFVFLVAAVIASHYVFETQGGLGTLLENLFNNPAAPEDLLSYHGNLAGAGASTPLGSLLYSIVVGVAWMITVSISPWQSGRNMMAKNEHVIFRSAALSTIFTFAINVLVGLTAVAVNNLAPGMPDPERVMIWASFNAMPKFVGVLLLAGIMAAGLSSASTFMSLLGFTAANDLFDLKNKGEKEQLKISRFVMLGVSILVLFLACLDFGSIRIITWMTGYLISASLCVIGFGSVWSKKLSANGAFWSVVGGFCAFVAATIAKEIFYLPLNYVLDPIFIGILFSLVCAVIGTKKSPKTEQEVRVHSALMVLPESEKDAKAYKRDKVYGWLIIAFGILVLLIMLFCWAIPYNQLVK